MSNKKIKNDFYEYVNEDWLKKATIPSDRSSISSFGELDLSLEKLLKSLIEKWTQDRSSIPNDPYMKEYVKYYSMILDTKKRDELGWEPLRSFLNKIENLTSFKDLFVYDKELWLNYSYLPLEISIYEDFVDNKKRIFWLGDNPTILPNKDIYSNEEEKNKLLKAWSSMVYDLLIDYGKHDLEAKEMIKKAIKFDNLYKDYVLSSVEQADYIALYNPTQKEEFEKITNQISISKLLKTFVNTEIDFISITNKKVYNEFDKIYSKENFEDFKALFFIKNLLANTSYLSEKIRIKSTEYSRVVYSVDEYRSLENFAFDKTNSYFGMPLGMYYAKEYFGEKSKANIENMVQKMIGVYKNRLLNNEWLSKTTIEKALLKLSTIKVMIGYPEIIRPYYKEFSVKTYEEGGDIFSNSKNFDNLIKEYSLSLYGKTEDERYWGMSPATVNAYYNPLKNQIVFPAAILSDPFYKYGRVSSANYGSIGAVIAHEISHGFDNHGAQFDENGKLNNWWTEEDKKEFEKRTKAVIELYDKRETPFGQVNGELTVSENIADLGGFDCALEAAKLEEDFDKEEFFKSWARSWRSIYKEGTAKRLLESDVHAPAKIRANVILANSDLFAQTYSIEKEDGMYVAPEKRVKIW